MILVKTVDNMYATLIIEYTIQNLTSEKGIHLDGKVITASSLSLLYGQYCMHCKFAYALLRGAKVAIFTWTEDPDPSLCSTVLDPDFLFEHNRIFFKRWLLFCIHQN